MKTLFLVLTFLFGLAACEPDETVVSAQPEQLVGKWRLVEPASPYQVSLQLSKHNELGAFPFSFRLTGESSVNYYSGVLTYNAGGLIDARSQIAISSVGSTKRGGSSEAIQFEQAYFANLGAVNRYEQTSGNRLRLYYGDGAQPGVLVYKRIQ